MKKSIAAKLFAVTLTAATIMTVAVPAFAMSDTSNATAEQSAGMTEDSFGTVETYEEVIARCENTISRYIVAIHTEEEALKTAQVSLDNVSNSSNKDQKEKDAILERYETDIDAWLKTNRECRRQKDSVNDMYREVCLCLKDAMNTRAAYDKKLDDLTAGMQAAYENGDYEMNNELNAQYSSISLIMLEAENVVNNLTQCKNNLINNMSEYYVDTINAELVAK